MSQTVSNSNTTENEKKKAQDDANRDPLSGRAGAHPVGTGIGAAAGGAAAGIATGAAIGTVAGPVGTAIGAAAGAAVGAIAGGLAGKGVAEAINPTEEHGYWRGNYTSRPYVEKDANYEQYGPAYQYGWEAQSRAQGQDFASVESDLARDWERSRGASTLSWDSAKEAVKDSWSRVADRTNKGTTESKGATTQQL